MSPNIPRPDQTCAGLRCSDLQLAALLRADVADKVLGRGRPGLSPAQARCNSANPRSSPAFQLRQVSCGLDFSCSLKV
jgi:hypothetical protein